MERGRRCLYVAAGLKRDGVLCRRSWRKGGTVEALKSLARTPVPLSVSGNSAPPNRQGMRDITRLHMGISNILFNDLSSLPTSYTIKTYIIKLLDSSSWLRLLYAPCCQTIPKLRTSSLSTVTSTCRMSSALRCSKFPRASAAPTLQPAG